MSITTDRSGTRLIIPAFRGLYGALHDASETLLRVVAGGMLAIHGAGMWITSWTSSSRTRRWRS